MGIRQDRSKDKPPRVDIQFRDWDEYDEYVNRVNSFGGKLGGYGRIVLLRDARAARKETEVQG